MTRLGLLRTGVFLSAEEVNAEVEMVVQSGKEPSQMLQMWRNRKIADSSLKSGKLELHTIADLSEGKLDWSVTRRARRPVAQPTSCVSQRICVQTVSVYGGVMSCVSQSICVQPVESVHGGVVISMIDASAHDTCFVLHSRREVNLFVCSRGCVLPILSRQLTILCIVTEHPAHT